MPTDIARISDLVRKFDFKKLFIEELGWDRTASTLPTAIEGTRFTFSAVAKKCEFHVFECVIPKGQPFPDRAARMILERQVARSAFEHLLVFTDQNRTRQVWQWVRRETGRPRRCHEQTFSKGQSGEALAHKLQ